MEQCLAGGLHDFAIFPLFRGQVGVQQQAGHADDPVHGRADFVAHCSQKLALETAALLNLGDPGLQYLRMAKRRFFLRVRPG